MIKCNLAVLMAERGLNIQDVANETGLSRTTISALVNENGKGIQFDTMNDLCELLKVTPGQLFTFVSLHTEINIHSTEGISIDEIWHSTPIDEKNDLEIQEFNIRYISTMHMKIKQDSHTFDSLVSFKVDILVVEGELRSLSYAFKNSNELDEILKKLQFFIREALIEKIEEVLIEGAVEFFDEVNSIGSLSITSDI